MSIEQPGFDESEPDELPVLTPLQFALCVVWFFMPFIALCFDALVSRHG
ncbi:hypothetical protein [Aquabacterium sp. CECT 9606]|nr:hypothetical protein [Aquabacterium sp. CECT 9606]CAH0352813.1 hypothetical protein AQB9606_02827 [Aquabacterium sp. CECT 9606]